MKKRVILTVLLLILLAFALNAEQGQPLHPAADANSTACGDVNSNITLTANITANGTCFNFNSSGIIFNGAGFTIFGNGAGLAFNVTNFSSAIIQNVTIQNFTTGIYLQDSNSSYFHNISITSANHLSASGIILNHSSLNLFKAIDIALVNLTENNKSNFSITFNGTAYNVDGLSKPTLNLTKGVKYFFEIIGMTGSSLYITNDPNGSEFTAGGITNGVINRYVDNGTIVYLPPDSQTGPLYYQSNNDSDRGGTINLLSHNARGLILTGRSEQNTFVNPNITTQNSKAVMDDTGSWNNFIVFNNSMSQIDWTRPSTFTANLSFHENLETSKFLEIGNNTVFVHPPSFPKSSINATANITLFITNYSNMGDFVVFKDGTECLDCTYLNNSPVTFTVTSFSNYTTVLNDTQAPNVSHVTPNSSPTYNVSQMIWLTANISDTNLIYQWANVSYNNTSTSHRMALANDTEYNTSFTIPNWLGTYNITFSANDSFGNVNSSQTANFTVVDSYPPAVSFNLPHPSQNLEENATFHINVTVTDHILVDTVYANISLPNSSNKIVTLEFNTTDQKYIANFNLTDVYGTYNISLWANDSSGNINLSVNRSITIHNKSIPYVTLYRPLNNSYHNSSSIHLRCNASDLEGLLNATLYVNFTAGNWTPNETGTISGVNNSFNQTYTGLADGTYTWNCLVWDNDSNSHWAFTNNTFIIDTDTPNITINTPTAAQNTHNLKQAVNVTATETSWMFFEWENETNFTLCTSCENATLEINVTSLDRHHINVFATDRAENVNNQSLWFILSLDTDNDGTNDTVETDDDNDGALDTVDFVNGDASNINTNFPVLNMTINGTYNYSQFYDDVYEVRITNNTDILLQFNYNFSTNQTLNMGNITIVTNEKENGGIVVSGFTIPDGGTKTVWFSDLSSNTTICVYNGYKNSTSVLTKDCSDGNETRISCTTSGTQEGYTCTDLGSRYRVAGLNHSVVGEVTGPVTASSSSSGGGGGGGGSGSSGGSGLAPCPTGWTREGIDCIPPPAAAQGKKVVPVDVPEKPKQIDPPPPKDLTQEPEFLEKVGAVFVNYSAYWFALLIFTVFIALGVWLTKHVQREEAWHEGAVTKKHVNALKRLNKRYDKKHKASEEDKPSTTKPPTPIEVPVPPPAPKPQPKPIHKNPAPEKTIVRFQRPTDKIVRFPKPSPKQIQKEIHKQQNNQPLQSSNPQRWRAKLKKAINRLEKTTQQESDT